MSDGTCGVCGQPRPCDAAGWLDTDDALDWAYRKLEEITRRPGRGDERMVRLGRAKEIVRLAVLQEATEAEAKLAELREAHRNESAGLNNWRNRAEQAEPLAAIGRAVLEYQTADDLATETLDRANSNPTLEVWHDVRDSWLARDAAADRLFALVPMRWLPRHAKWQARLTVKRLGRGVRRTDEITVSDGRTIAAGDVISIGGERLRVVSVGSLRGEG